MKTAIFLGAGASAADGAPLQADIIPDFFKLLRESDNTNPKLEFVKRRLTDYFKDFFSIDVRKINDNTKFPTFEEALGIMELSDLKSDVFMNDLYLYHHRHYVHTKSNMILMLIWILTEKLLGQTNYCHKHLVENLQNDGLLKDVCFITTNYDLLIDNSIQALNGIFERENIPDYGQLDFRNYHFEENNNSYLIKPTDEAIKLYKLHGSLNWTYCQICNTLTLHPGEKALARLIYDYDYIRCPDCHSEPIPIIVPPTYFKNMGNVYLSNVWNQAEITLHNIEHIVFCGYSFPDADMHVKYLIKRAQIYNHNDVKFTIINNYPGKSEESKSIEKLRYTRFLGKKHVNYIEDGLSFNDFCDNPRRIIRH